MKDNGNLEDAPFQNIIAKEIKRSILKTLTQYNLAPTASTNIHETALPKKTFKEKLQEAFVVIPRSFHLRTEKLSTIAKQAHERLYKEYVEAFNRIESAIAAANTENAKSSTSEYRSLKNDEIYNLNAIKLHELYFANISDVASEISVDSLPFMRLSRDFGTFEKWQFDFIACAMCARSGWAITYFEPYRNVYLNAFIDNHDTNILLGAVPILVIDMWEHAYHKDYADDKKLYLFSMMKEINWHVVEARMMIAEKTSFNELYKIVPVVNDVPQNMINAAKTAINVIPSNKQINTNNALNPSTENLIVSYDNIKK